MIESVVPHGFLGRNAVGKSNRAVLNRNIDAFVKARKFETLALGHIMNDVKVIQNMIAFSTLKLKIT